MDFFSLNSELEHQLNRKKWYLHEQRTGNSVVLVTD